VEIGVARPRSTFSAWIFSSEKTLYSRFAQESRRDLQLTSGQALCEGEGMQRRLFLQILTGTAVAAPVAASRAVPNPLCVSSAHNCDQAVLDAFCVRAPWQHPPFGLGEIMPGTFLLPQNPLRPIRCARPTWREWHDGEGL
jgi:hypothetical protein